MFLSRLADESDEMWADALCRSPEVKVMIDSGNNPFYPEQHDEATARFGRSICYKCPIQAECLEYAIEHDEPYGTWGGAPIGEREWLRNKRKLTYRQYAAIECGTPRALERHRRLQEAYCQKCKELVMTNKALYGIKRKRRG